MIAAVAGMVLAGRGQTTASRSLSGGAMGAAGGAALDCWAAISTTNSKRAISTFDAPTRRVLTRAYRDRHSSSHRPFRILSPFKRVDRPWAVTA
jgi:hypothetical protein